jgi:hypothetical protein
MRSSRCGGDANICAASRIVRKRDSSTLRRWRGGRSV